MSVLSLTCHLEGTAASRMDEGGNRVATWESEIQLLALVQFAGGGAIRAKVRSSRAVLRLENYSSQTRRRRYLSGSKVFVNGVVNSKADAHYVTNGSELDRSRGTPNRQTFWILQLRSI